MFVGGNGNFSEVDNEEVLDDFVVLDVFLGLGDQLEDVLGLGGLGGLAPEEAFDGELSSVHFVNSLLVVLDSALGLRLGSFNAFFPGNALKQRV